MWSDQNTLKDGNLQADAAVAPPNSHGELHPLQRLIALASLVIIAPLLFILYIIVKVDSKGSFIYEQQRPGYLGLPFFTFKIRTMSVGSDQNAMLARVVDIDAPEVTRVGRYLRELKLDELPQLWNIARGEMAFVGPRPIAPALQQYLETMIPGFSVRLTVLPGLTSLGQVCIDENDSVERVVDDWAIRFEAERHYLINRSNNYDFVIILMTIGFCLRKLVKVLSANTAFVYIALSLVLGVLLLSSCVAGLDMDGVQQLNGERTRPIPWQKDGNTNAVLAVEKISVAALIKGNADPLYRLGPEDRIFVSVYGEPGLDKIEAQLDGAGNVQLPMLERINVANLSLGELQTALKRAYGKHFIDPWVVTGLSEALSRPIHLLGEFNQPGIIYMTRATNVLQALGEGHGLAENAFTRGARLIRGEKILAIDLHALLNLGHMDQNIWLTPHDTIFIPSKENLRIFVLGAVLRPGAQVFTNSGMTLGEAIAKSGGERRGQANLKDVRVIRSYSPVAGELYVVDFSSVIEGLATDMILEPGDIIYVPVNRVGSWNDVIDAISPSILLLSRALDPFLLAKALTSQ